MTDEIGEDERKLWKSLAITLDVYDLDVVKHRHVMAKVQNLVSHVRAFSRRSTIGGAGTDRKVVWLIERKGFAGDPRPHWYWEERGFHAWTPEASAALPFATEAEAKAFPSYRMISRDPDISVTEHVFMEAAALAASPPLPTPDRASEAVGAFPLAEEIDVQEKRLLEFCNAVNAGHAQGGGREFARQIDAAFRYIKTAAASPPLPTPDRAKLIERLRNVLWNEDHKRGCPGREYTCKCGYDDKIIALTEEAADALSSLDMRPVEGYIPQVIEFEEAGYGQLVLEDTAMIHAEEVTVTALRRMSQPRELIGFQWELPLTAAPRPVEGWQP